MTQIRSAREIGVAKMRMSLKVVSLWTFLFRWTGKRRRCLRNAHCWYCQFGQVESWPREFAALEYEYRQIVWVKFVLWAYANQLRETRGNCANHFNRHWVSGVLQYDSVALHAVSEWASAVPKMQSSIWSMSHLQGSLQCREMSVSWAGEKYTRCVL